MKKIIITVKEVDRDGIKKERFDMEMENCSPTESLGMVEHARAILRASAIQAWSSKNKEDSK